MLQDFGKFSVFSWLLKTSRMKEIDRLMYWTQYFWRLQKYPKYQDFLGNRLLIDYLQKLAFSLDYGTRKLISS